MFWTAPHWQRASAIRRRIRGQRISSSSRCRGVIYTGGGKLAEHGGATDDDRHVPLLVSAAGLSGATIVEKVATAQIAPSILRFLKLSPTELDAVKAEGTAVLPGLRP